MNDKINDRTPEEIKKGLEIVKDECLKVECSSSTCPYYKNCAPRTGMMREVPAQLVRDNIKYIQQLEAERDQYKRERDALVEFIVGCCDECKHRVEKWFGRMMNDFCVECIRHDYCNWQWRGVQEVVE